MIVLDRVSVTYPDATAPTLRAIDLHVPEGELCLLIGPTGAGKSTLLGTINGLVPHFTGGLLQGRVTVAGRDTSNHPPRDLADIVGYVGQDPTNGFVTDVVEEELAYGMESLGLSADVMRRRVEETLDLLGLADLRGRALMTLSGGERQRVAIGGVLAAHPSVLVLDEPTSALDPAAAEEVLALLHRLVHDLGLTVVLAEHRLERVVQYADRIIELSDDGRSLRSGAPQQILVDAAVAPPVVELGRLAGWSPPPLSIRDARRLAGPLRERLQPLAPPSVSPTSAVTAAGAATPVAEAVDITVTYGTLVALREVSVSVTPGEVVALMGRNGAGKSTLLNALCGLVEPTRGQVRVAGREPATLDARTLITHVGMVPQQPGDLLYADTVAAECADADRDSGAAPGTCRRLLEQLVPGLDLDAHPRDLSEGQQLGLVLALVLAANPPLLLLDEPTRGLDYAAKRRLGRMLAELADEGRTIVLATHDVELAALVASRTIVVADGELVVDGPTVEVVLGSPAFAPQIANVLTPAPWMTVEQVARALDALDQAS